MSKADLRTKLILAVLLLFLAPFLMAPGCGRPPILVHKGESIQAAGDSALPGDTILVLPSVYTSTPGHESVVDVQTSGITITASRNAIIDAAGFEYGITVGPDAPINAGGSPATAFQGFTLDGLTIRNSDHTGVRMVAVDDFVMWRARYIDNDEYGPFPVCSTNGLIELNHVSGSNDAGIYVGDDVNVHVRDNFVTDSVAGIEIENSLNSEVTGNVLTGNTAGILAFVLPGLPQPFNDTVLIEDNEIPDNGAKPDPLRALTPGVDIVFISDVINTATGMLRLVDPDPTDNCFADNTFDTDFPPGITALLPCP